MSADGNLPSPNAWGEVAGFGGEITGFADSYPSPVSGLALDAIASPPPNRTAGSEADSDGATPGFSGISTTTQALAGAGASGLDIIANLDTSITDLTGTLYSGVTAAINAAISFYAHEITTPITITIDFGYGELDNGLFTLGRNDLGESLANYDTVPYGTLVAALASHADSVGLDDVAANLPPTITSAGSTFSIADADSTAWAIASTSLPAGDDN